MILNSNTHVLSYDIWPPNWNYFFKIFFKYLNFHSGAGLSFFFLLWSSLSRAAEAAGVFFSSRAASSWAGRPKRLGRFLVAAQELTCSERRTRARESLLSFFQSLANLWMVHNNKLPFLLTYLIKVSRFLTWSEFLYTSLIEVLLIFAFILTACLVLFYN